MEKEKKTYVGNGKAFGKSGIRFVINLTKLQEAIKNGECNNFQNKSGDTMVSVNVWGNETPDQYDNTHSMVCDTWKPDPDKKKSVQATSNDTHLPF